MDYFRNFVSLPDEVLVALNHFLNNIKPTCEEKSPAKSFPISDDDSDEPIFRLIDYKYSMPPKMNSDEKEQARAQGKSCCQSSTNDPPFYQEQNSEYPCQDQEISQHSKRSCQQCQQRFARSQSVPRGNFTERYIASERFDCPGGLPAGQEAKKKKPRGCNAARNSDDFQGQETKQPPRGRSAARNSDDFQGQETKNPPRRCCAACNSCEGDVATPDAWINSSAVGINYGEWQKHPSWMEPPQQQQRHRQRQSPPRRRQSNECNMASLEDDEISRFESDLNSTMIDEGKRQKSSKYPQPQVPRQNAPSNKTCGPQSYETPQEPRRSAKVTRQRKSNECNMSSLEDDEISGFEPDINSTMIDEGKRQKSSTNYPQPPMTRQNAPCNKTCGPQSYETPEVPRRSSKVTRQRQSNECNLSSLGDDEISRFERDLNSTMIDEEKHQKSSTNYPQPQMSRQNAPCNKTCGPQIYETPQMSRRLAQRNSSQMQRRYPCESLRKQRRKDQQYETLINETSYLDLPKALREDPRRTNTNRNQCNNSQAMYQDVPPLREDPCRKSIDRNQYPNSQAMYQDAPPLGEAPYRKSIDRNQCPNSQAIYQDVPPLREAPYRKSIDRNQCPNSQAMYQDSTPLREAPYRKSIDRNQCPNSQAIYQDVPPLPEASYRTSIDRNQCPNSQAMYQDVSSINFGKQPQTSPRSRSLNCSKYQSANDTDLEMEETDMFPEDANRTRSPTYMDMSRAMMARSRLNQTNSEKTNQDSCCGGRSKRMRPKMPEEYLAERTQDEFMDALVKDRSCPGAIQSSLNGNDNFNEFAFDIAFAGPIPIKPFPVDPISMLEAIKLRIDLERVEIRKHSRPITSQGIESYFDDKCKTEVNEGVAAFLKAEIEYQSDKPDTFEAQINSLETNMLDESIKLNVFSATTQPCQKAIELA